MTKILEFCWIAAEYSLKTLSNYLVSQKYKI